MRSLLKNTKRIWLGIAVVLGLSPCPTLLANTQQENAELSRINSVLNSVYPLIDAAQKQANPHVRVQFHYDWLRQDIESIQSGIAKKINAAPIVPRAVTPLNTQLVKE